MPILSCKYTTPVKIVSSCLMVLAVTLHSVGISAKKWDGIDDKLVGIQISAYQNLWMSFDAGRQHGYAFYVGFDYLVSTWKPKILYLETTGLGFAVLSLLLLVIAPIVFWISKRSKIHITMTVCSIIGAIIACGETTAGVLSYFDNYMRILSKVGLQMVDYAKSIHEPEKYKLTWAPYLCIGAGGIYGLVALLLIIDLIIQACQHKKANLVDTVEG